MTILAELSLEISQALRIPLGEVEAVARRQREAAPPPPAAAAPEQHIGAAEAARLLVGVMVMRIEGSATPAAALTADIERLARLQHGALLYLDTDFILPGDYVGAVGEILAALADPARRERAREWIGRIGVARGGGRMAGWVEVRSPQADDWEDFDYAASPEDLGAIMDAAPIVRRVEVRLSALLQIAAVLAPIERAGRASAD